MTGRPLAEAVVPRTLRQLLDNDDQDQDEKAAARRRRRARRSRVLRHG